MSDRRISVILPTFGRADVLARTVAAWRAELDSAQDELLVVDDGSVDGTPQSLRELQEAHDGLIRSWRQANAGPAAARNLALRHARGAWIFFAGDDVLPHTGLVAAHLRAHARWPQTAILGEIRWHQEMPRSPFIEWLGTSGAQFAFAGLRHGDVLPATHLYTSNLSIPRQVLPPDPVFDETFRAACWEDVDLGIRLQAHGVTLRFINDAPASHLHPTDLATARRRAVKVGYYRAQLERKHQLRPARRWVSAELVKRAMAPVLRWMPIPSVRQIGFRWSLSWADWQGWRRFQRGAHVG